MQLRAFYVQYPSNFAIIITGLHYIGLCTPQLKKAADIHGEQFRVPQSH